MVDEEGTGIIQQKIREGRERDVHVHDVLHLNAFGYKNIWVIRAWELVPSEFARLAICIVCLSIAWRGKAFFLGEKREIMMIYFRKPPNGSISLISRS